MSVAFDTPRDMIDHYRAVRERLNPRARPTINLTVAAVPPRVECRERDIIDLRVPTGEQEGRWRVLYDWPIGPVASGEARGLTDAYFSKVALERTLERYAITREELVGYQRDKHLIRARHELCWLLKKHTAWSLPHIGRFMGGRDHTTIMHAVRNHAERIARGVEYDPGDRMAVLREKPRPCPAKLDDAHRRAQGRVDQARRKFRDARARLLEALL